MLKSRDTDTEAQTVSERASNRLKCGTDRAVMSSAVFGLALGPILTLGSGWILLQICSMPVLGSLLTWGMPILKQLLTATGVVLIAYTLFLAPSDNNSRVSTRAKLGIAVIMIGVGVTWSTTFTYIGTDMLGGQNNAMQAAMCGL